MLLEWLKWTNKIILCSQTREILLEAIFGDSYSITFGDGLVTVKPQPVTSNLSLLMSHHQ